MQHVHVLASGFEESLERGDIVEAIEGGKSLYYMNRKKLGQKEEGSKSWEGKSKVGLLNHSMKTLQDTIDELGWKLEVLLIVVHGLASLCFQDLQVIVVISHNGCKAMRVDKRHHASRLALSM